MTRPGIAVQITRLLQATNHLGGYPASLVCTDKGLLIASAGDTVRDEELAGFTSLFDDIVVRAQRDLDMEAIDEVSLLDGARGRTIIRVLPLDSPDLRLFLVVRVPRNRTWRRNTNRLFRELVPVLEPLVLGEVA